MADKDTGIGFIGGGNMACAIIGGLLEAGHAPACISVADPDPGRRDAILSLHRDIAVTADNRAVADDAEVLVLAVKPQVLPAVCADLGQRPDSQLVISIAAGVRLSTLTTLLGEQTAIVRIMPNQPALVGAGMSVLTGAGTVTAAQRQTAQYLAAAVGETGWVDDESLIDAVTAISGSGPAYFYLLMEILERTAIHMGIPEDLAGRLARQTGYGAGLTAVRSADSLDALRASVTSPGGTTAAAIESLEAADIRAIFHAALEAARNRSVELGNTDASAATDH